MGDFQESDGGFGGGDWQLGRAQVMMGDKIAARKSYEEFLTLWKDADQDIPIYKQAKAEYARLGHPAKGPALAKIGLERGTQIR